MRRYRIILPFLLTAALASSCKSGGDRENSLPARLFPEVQIPTLYTDENQRKEYAASHFWDRMLSDDGTVWRNDSTFVLGVKTDELESRFATYVTVLESIDIRKAMDNSLQLFRTLEARHLSDSTDVAYGQFCSLMEKYLYDSNSPYRNEDIYYPFIKARSESSLTPETLKAGYAHDARLCSLNCIGTVATDFIFTDLKGKTHSLHGIKADYTLLFFSNPGCTACKEIIDMISQNAYVGAMLSSGRLAVVNVYIDEDLEAWRAYQSHYPEEWYNGYDPLYSIREDLKYSVRAIPSLYLLDSEKRVIMKDAPEEHVLGYISVVASR